MGQALKERVGKASDRHDHVFTVVKHQQELPVLQPRADSLLVGPPARAGQPETGSDRGAHQRRLTDRRELSQPSAVRVPRGGPCGHLQGEPSLANACGADERGQGCFLEPIQELAHLGAATDEYGAQDRQLGKRTRGVVGKEHRPNPTPAEGSAQIEAFTSASPASQASMLVQCARARRRRGGPGAGLAYGACRGKLPGGPAAG